MYIIVNVCIKKEYSMEVGVMKEVRYMISDTAKKVDVEAHVLRYWEEELELTIGRTEMGHRYYTPDDIVLFKNIKELKEQGFQLKAIKMLMPELIKNKGNGIDNLLLLREELNEKAGSMAAEVITVKEESENEMQIVTLEQSGQVQSQDDKIIQFQEIIKNIVLDALHENNEDLQKEMGREVGDHVVKEVDYIMRMQDEKDEERFKKLDEVIRGMQVSRQEAAAAKKEGKKKHFRLSRKEKKAAKQ